MGYVYRIVFEENRTPFILDTTEEGNEDDEDSHDHGDYHDKTTVYQP